MTDFHQPQNQRAPISGGKGLLLLLIVLLIAVILAVAGIIPRLRARTTLQAQTTSLAAPSVLVQKPQLGQPSEEIVLPGNVQAYVDSPIYARTSGYLKKWYFDIGARVKKGQLLATIESPEVDQQLAQARADLSTAQANAAYAKTQAARYQDLVKGNAVSQQDADNYNTQQAATTTQVKSAQANVDRLEQLVGFESIYAPFDGVVTVRNVDIGTLIDVGTGRELFHLADEHILRVYVNVPQPYSLAASVPGLSATLTLAEFPNRSFEGKVVRTSNAIDLTSRTLLVEVDVPNPKRELYPGAYAQVHFKIKDPQPTLIIPVGALMFRSEGLRVGIVEGDKAKLVPIKIGRDDGRTVEIVSGLSASDLVIVSPPDSLIDGETVRVVQPHSSGEPGVAPAPANQAGGK